MKKIIFAFCLTGMLAAGASGKDCAALGEVYRIGADLENKVQSQVLDAMLEPGKSYAFLEVKAELRASSEGEEKSGTGETRKKISGEEAPDKSEGRENMQEQKARQVKRSLDRKETFRLELSGMKLKVLHDSAVPPARLKAVKEVLLALFRGKLEAADLIFVAAPFQLQGFSEATAGE